jgi:hypothetical protein
MTLKRSGYASARLEETQAGKRYEVDLEFQAWNQEAVDNTGPGIVLRRHLSGVPQCALVRWIGPQRSEQADKFVWIRCF